MDIGSRYHFFISQTRMNVRLLKTCVSMVLVPTLMVVTRVLATKGSNLDLEEPAALVSTMVFYCLWHFTDDIHIYAGSEQKNKFG